MKKPLELEQRALDAFIRTGDLSADPPGGSAPAAERRDLSEASPQVTQTQSVIVQGAFYRALLVAMKAYDRLFDPEVTTFVSSKNGSSMLIPCVDDTGNAATVPGEAQQDTESDPTISGVVVPTASTYRTNMVKLSRELLEDSGIDPADFLAKAFAIRLARGIGSAIVTTAIAGASSGATGGSNSTVTPEDVRTLIKSVDPAYLEAEKAGLAMSYATWIAVKGTKTTTGAYVIPRMSRNCSACQCSYARALVLRARMRRV
jgi:HK97 family phage major capsid protein